MSIEEEKVEQSLDYSERKKYQLGHGNESPSPMLKEVLDSLHHLHDRVDNAWIERKKKYE